MRKHLPQYGQSVRITNLKFAMKKWLTWSWTWWPTLWLTKNGRHGGWQKKPDWQKDNNKDKDKKIQLENTPKEGFLKTFKEHPQMAIPEKFWVWPLIYCYEFRPFQTKLMRVDQTSQFRPNFTISSKFHNPGILGIPGVRAVSQFSRCFFTGSLKSQTTKISDASSP